MALHLPPGRLLIAGNFWSACSVPADRIGKAKGLWSRVLSERRHMPVQMKC